MKDATMAEDQKDQTAADTVGSPKSIPEPEAEKTTYPKGSLGEAAHVLVPLVVQRQAPTNVMPQGPLQKAEDVLHRGNVVAALKENTPLKKSATPPVSADKPVIHNETSFERNIREIGLAGPAHEEKPKKPVEKKERTLQEISETAEGTLPRLRTYATDISEEIRKRGTTLTKIASAEQARELERPRDREDLSSIRPARRWIIIAGTVLLILFGVGGILAALTLTGGMQTTPPHVGLIAANRHEIVPLDERKPLAVTLGAARAGATLELGEVEELIIRKNGTALPVSDLLTALGAPNELVRNASGITVGVHAANHNQPFIVVSITAYDRAFEAMLSWENTMGETLGDFFAPAQSALGSIVNTAPPLAFTDRVFSNTDIRESQTNWHILYAFPRQDILIITTNESTLREVVTRLSLKSGN